MTDIFGSHTRSSLSPPQNGSAVVPDNGADLPNDTKAIHAGGAGNPGRHGSVADAGVTGSAVTHFDGCLSGGNNGAVFAEGHTWDGCTSDPLVPLGHHGGNYHFISPSNELRQMSAGALEAGRGVSALFLGMGPEIESWCRSKFPQKGLGWCPRQAGKWIIEQCNGQGVFDPGSADLRSIGVWRNPSGEAVAHCGNRLMYPCGRVVRLQDAQGKQIMVGATPISLPDVSSRSDSFRELQECLSHSWGWRRPEDAAIWLGWVAAASLGGFPDWRAHLYVHGSHGSGKSRLMELAGCLLGDLAGKVLNDPTEAGLRQSQNNYARPVLIDEFEPDENPRNSSRQDSVIGLFRRMSGKEGGRVSRGGADHTSVSFRALGAAYVTSINHIHLEPQDRSRFVFMKLGILPNSGDPAETGLELERLIAWCTRMSAGFRGRMLAQSHRWNETFTGVSARARSLGADARQADTAATIVTGLDLLLFDGAIDEQRVESHEPLLSALIGDTEGSDDNSEGQDALDFLLSTELALDHGIRRTVRELTEAVVLDVPCPDVVDPVSALGRASIFVLPEKRVIAVRSGRTTATAQLYASTKWRNGAHASALLLLDGVERPRGPVRVSKSQQTRVLTIDYRCLQLGPEP